MSTANKPVSTSVRFTRRESSQFRLMHVDGFYGGPAPSGMLYIQVFTLLPPMPTEIVQEISPNGTVGRELSRQVEVAIEHRVEAGLLMSEDVTRALRDWLSQQLEALESIRKEASK